MASNTVFAPATLEDCAPQPAEAPPPVSFLPELQAAKSSLERLLAALPRDHRDRIELLSALAVVRAEIAQTGQR